MSEKICPPGTYYNPVAGQCVPVGISVLNNDDKAKEIKKESEKE